MVSISELEKEGVKISTVGAKPKEEKKSFLRNLVTEVTRPIARAGETIAQGGRALAGLADVATGGTGQEAVDRIRSISEGGRESSTYGNVKPINNPIDAAGVGTQLSSFLPVGRVLSAPGQLLKSVTPQLAREGAVAGALNETGEQVQDREFDPLSVVGESALGAGGAAALGVPLSAVSPFLRQMLADTTAGQAAAKDTASKYLTKAVGISGKMSGDAFRKVQESRVKGLKVLSDLAENIKVKDEFGQEKVFNPAEATFPETVQALVRGKKALYDTYSGLAKQATGMDVQLDLKPLMEELSKFAQGPRIGVVKNRAESLIEELTAIPKDPSSVMTYLEDINTGLGAKFLGRSETATKDVDMAVAKGLRKTLDEAIEKATESDQFLDLRRAYGDLKALEQPLVLAAQKGARQMGGGLEDYVDILSSGEILMGVLSANPALIAKGTIQGFLGGARRYLRNPERQLQKAFKSAKSIKDIRVLSDTPTGPSY